MEQLFRDLKLEKAPESNEHWLQENLLHPFINGTGVLQVYDTLAGKPLDLYKVPHADILSSNWCAQALSSAAGAIIPFVLAGKLTGGGLKAISSGLALEGVPARILANEHLALISGAGLYTYAQKPAEGQTRLSAALGTMTAFTMFLAGNSALAKSLPSLSKSSALSLINGSGRIVVGGLSGMAGYETQNHIASMQGYKHESSWNERIDAAAHGAFINFALPVVQSKASKAVESLAQLRGKASEPGPELELKVERRAEMASELKTGDIKTGDLKAGDITKASESYEKWMAERIKTIPEDLEFKHSEMADSTFKLFRGTYYRWAERFPRLLPELQNAPKVNSVGDLHVENFGTWKDGKGRKIWGINDFDESYRLPYTNDLVRLLTSAKLLKEEGGLKSSTSEAADAILKGYRQGLKEGGKPFVLDETNARLAKLAEEQSPDATKYWKKIERQIESRPAPALLSQDAVSMLRSSLPDQSTTMQIGHRVSGVGSLGRQRFAALAEYQGNKVASEIKSLLPSANDFVLGHKNGESQYAEIIKQAVREPDPRLRLSNDWVSRALSPERFKIKLDSLTHAKDESLMLWSMGYETANVHLGTKGAARSIIADLKSRESNWLLDAAKKMSRSTEADYSKWTETHLKPVHAPEL